jgi:hypothetical protein
MDAGPMLQQIDYVLAKLDWMREERIWPNGLRYLWTDAFGVVLLVSLYRQLGDARWLDEAEELVADVERVLGRERGLRIGASARRDRGHTDWFEIAAPATVQRVREAYRVEAADLAV